MLFRGLTWRVKDDKKSTLILALLLPLGLGAQSLSYGGGFATGSIRPSGSAVYEFPASANDLVTVEWGETVSRNGLLCVRVFDSSTDVFPRTCLNTSPANALSRSFRIARSQMHKLEVSERSADGDMPYRVRIVCSGRCPSSPDPFPYPSDPAASLTFGATYEGIVQRGAGPVRLSFLASSAGDAITINLAERQPATSAQPCLTVRGPSGTQIAARCSSLSVTETVRIAAPGPQTVEVYELGNDQILFFRVVISCSGMCSMLDPGSPAPEPGRITAQPSQIDLVLPAGQSGLASVPLQLLGEKLSGSVLVSSKEVWIKPSTTTGVLPAQIAVTIDAASVPSAGGSGIIEIVLAGNPAAKLSVPVTVRVETTDITVYPSGIVLQDDKPQLILVRSNVENAAPSVEVLGKKLAQSVRVTPSSGDATDQDRVLSIAAVGSLGRQAGALKISSGGAAVTVPVTMRSANAAGVRPLINELNFGGPPAQQLAWRVLHVANPTEREHQCTVTSTHQWLFVYPAAFGIGAGKVKEIKVEVNTSGQRAARQEGRLEVKCWPAELTDRASETRDAVVRLDVSTRLQNLDLDLSGVLLSGKAGEMPACRGLGAPLAKPCLLTFTNRTLNKAPFSFSFEPGKPALVTFVPSSGDVSPQVGDKAGTQTVQIRPVVFPQGLQQGFRHDLATLKLNGVESKLDVHMLVTGSNDADAEPCQARGVQILPMQGGREFVAVAGSARPLDVEVLDDCGKPFQGSVMAIDRRSGKGVVPQSLSNSGRWQGIWVAPAVFDTARTALEYRATDSNGRLLGTARQDALFESDRDTPLLNVAGVRMGPSLSPGVMTPGALVTIGGRNLAFSAVSVERGPWPTNLNGVEVRVAGREASIGSVEPEKITMQVPWDVPTGVSADLIVVREGRHATPLEVSIVEADPEILSIRNQANQEIQDRGPGVHAGESVWIHATGLGRVSAQMDTGVAAAEPGVAPRCPVVIDLGERRITPASSELSTTEVGVYRIRIDLPQDAAGVLPLVLRCGADSFAESKIEVRP